MSNDNNVKDNKVRKQYLKFANFYRKLAMTFSTLMKYSQYRGEKSILTFIRKCSDLKEKFWVFLVMMK